MKTALLLIDIQNDYFPGGKMELTGSEKAANNAERILARFRQNKDLVIHIRHLSVREDAAFFIPNTPGAEIHECLEPLAEEKIITKHFPNSFIHTELLSILQQQQIEHLVVAGMMTHLCVDATVRAAKDLGFTIELIGDACATKELELNGRKLKAEDVHASFLSALNYFYSNVVTTTAYLRK